MTALAAACICIGLTYIAFTYKNTGLYVFSSVAWLGFAIDRLNDTPIDHTWGLIGLFFSLGCAFFIAQGILAVRREMSKQQREFRKERMKKRANSDEVESDKYIKRMDKSISKFRD